MRTATLGPSQNFVVAPVDLRAEIGYNEDVCRSAWFGHHARAGANASLTWGILTNTHYLTGLTVLLAASAASAGTVTNATVSPTKTSNGQFLAGSGISPNGFVIDTNDATNPDGIDGDAVALKIRNRLVPPQSINGNRYTIAVDDQPGMVSANDFTLDFQFTPGGSSTGDYSNYNYQFQFDSDPTAGVNFVAGAFTPFFDANMSDADGSFDDSDGFFTSGYSPSDAPFVVSNSFNVSESPITAATFGNLYRTAGEYTIQFNVFDGVTLVASAEAVAIVPEPFAATAGSSLLCLLGLRRKRSL